ncbi:DNA topoisomerase 2-associated protein pat1 [Saxophila tyrrhenica]|uniref:DNA topoisomerase 2-associated protein pat1 n=1 Tax=Saxophila tyrrhenica TaxID=1690608 RepID=A0AAV9P3J3_9PEZI|nr:DNA topoisomerase 2-associated protein pat1 [Saxophila tyrrhenica]
MSFFGFDTNLPRDRQGQTGGQSMFQQHDPFGGLRREDAGNQESLDFEDTYDGLGLNLDESGDTFNDDTFGSEEPVTRQDVGKDFDFAGQTSRMRGELLEEEALHHARQPMQYAQPSKQKKSGYEAYREPEYIPKLEADASIWGKLSTNNKKPAEQQAKQDSSARKMMSVEEVEAMMRSQSRPTPPVQDTERQSQGLRDMLGVGSPGPAPPQQDQTRPPVQILQRPQQQQQPPQQQPQMQQPMPGYNQRAPQILQRQHTPQQQGRPQSQDFQGQPPYPTQQQHPVQMPMGAPPGQPQQPRAPMQPVSHNRGPSYNGPPITQAQQMMNMSNEERETYLAEEAKRAKRNHKIFLLSKNNGLMTPQDKNFITRIQLQQLLTATGGVDNAMGSEEQLAEDFYYHVYSQIRAPPRSGPGQPLSHFAQTYLFQTGSRYGHGRNRNQPRGGDNHVQRMEQQVARAVEAAKARPKNKSLVVEGSLGKIAFSNSKTPRPLLNLKRADSESRMRPARQTTVADRKAALRDVEHLFTSLMILEDHERKMPEPPNEESPPDKIEGHIKWRTELQHLNQNLWEATKVMEPIQPNPTTPHPFIALLALSKSKKIIPRLFRHLDDQQRLTMLTLIVIHLDSLDVVRDAYPPADNTPLPVRVREEIALFDACIMPPLFNYVNEARLEIMVGLLGLVLERVHVQSILRTRIGVSMLTMLISRAELVAGSLPPNANQDDKQQWQQLYSRLFDTIEPVLPYIFPTTTNVAAADDVYVWQFLAAMGVGASPDQQQRLVLGVKERVMETVGVAKGLPQELAGKKLGEVNLFMRAIGLDVELLG